jgi:hypothetical protein
LTFRFGGKSTGSSAVSRRRDVVESRQQRAQQRKQRLVLTVAGGVAFSGLAMLAYHFTAPFADPPGFAATAQATAVVRTVPAIAKASTEPAGEADVALSPSDPAEPASQPASAMEPPAEPAPEERAETPDEPVSAAVETADAGPMETLAADDPRWAAGTTAPSGSTRTGSDSSGEALAYASESAAVAALRRSVADGATDETETAAIPAPRPAVEAIEREAPAASGGRAATRNATIARAVNMRAKGTRGAKVLGVIPRGATVGLVGCDGWCEVIYQGRRGFIYKSYLEGSSRTADASGSAQKRKPSKPKIVPVRQTDIDHMGR